MQLPCHAEYPGIHWYSDHPGSVLGWMYPPPPSTDFYIYTIDFTQLIDISVSLDSSHASGLAWSHELSIYSLFMSKMGFSGLLTIKIESRRTIWQITQFPRRHNSRPQLLFYSPWSRNVGVQSKRPSSDEPYVHVPDPKVITPRSTRTQFASYTSKGDLCGSFLYCWKSKSMAKVPQDSTRQAIPNSKSVWIPCVRKLRSL